MRITAVIVHMVLLHQNQITMNYLLKYNLYICIAGTSA